MHWLMLVAFFCAFSLLIVCLSKWRFTYWKRRGVEQLQPEFFYGNLRDLLTAKTSTGEAFQRIYTTLKNRHLPFGGIYFSYQPQFVPIDLHLIKDIMQKSFSHFQDRGLYHHENDLLTQNLFRMEGGPWRNLRVKMSPTFTSSRLKMMFETLCEKTAGFDGVMAACVGSGGKINVTDVAGRFTTDVIGSCAFGIECDSLKDGNCDFRMEGGPWRNLRVKMTPTFTPSRLKMMFETLYEKTAGFDSVMAGCVGSGGKINVTDVAGRFTTDVIGSCAFGIECDSLKDENCDFRVYSKEINRPRALKQWTESTVPRKLLCYTGYKSFPDFEEFFKGVVLQTIRHREKNDIFRKDFMHLLLQLRNRGKLSDDGKITGDENEKGILTDDEIIAQCFLFFLAGFDTSATTMSLALYELAKHQDIQERMRQEIQEVLRENEDRLTYEAVKELVYTEQVISETLRKYPLLPTIPRMCTKKYRIPNSKVILEKGTKVQIPAWGIHMDPEYYPEPDQFDPERFSEEGKAKRPDFSYLPFGEGPRHCIGARFGMMQTKVGLAKLVMNHSFSLLPETPRELSFEPFLLLLHAAQEIWLKIDKI